MKITIGIRKSRESQRGGKIEVFVNSHQPGVSWEEGALAEGTSLGQVSPPDWPGGKSVVRFFLISDFCVKTQSTVGSATPGQGLLGCIESRLNKPWGASQ